MPITPQQFDEMKARTERARRKLKGEDPLKPLAAEVVAHPPITKRIRQSSKPLMNKLEQEAFDRVGRIYFGISNLRAQAIKFKIGNNAFYKPDITGILNDKWVAWEVKGNGGKNIDRGILALKVAATQWPEIRFILIWKYCGAWREQIVQP